MEYHTVLAEGKSKEKSLRIPWLLGNTYILNAMTVRATSTQLWNITQCYGEGDPKRKE